MHFAAIGTNDSYYSGCSARGDRGYLSRIGRPRILTALLLEPRPSTDIFWASE